MPQELFPLFSAKFGDRLRWLRQKRGLSQAEIADGSASTASSWEKDGKMPRGDRWDGIAERLGLSWSLISNGMPVDDEDYAFIRENRNLINFAQAHPGVVERLNRHLPAALEEGEIASPVSGVVQPHEVPVISWARAGQATSYEVLPKEWQRTIFTMCRAAGAFGIEVEGDSMAPEFRAGDVVVVMPETEPRNQAPVVAKLKEDGVVLKIYTRSRDGLQITLSSINPAYPPLIYTPADFHWIYPVHSATRAYWK